MDRVWAAQIEVDAPLAAALIGGQFPALAPPAIEPLGCGWDNTVYRVNERYVFRFPRRRIAVDLIATEPRCLPVELAGVLGALHTLPIDTVPAGASRCSTPRRRHRHAAARRSSTATCTPGRSWSMSEAGSPASSTGAISTSGIRRWT